MRWRMLLYTWVDISQGCLEITCHHVLVVLPKSLTDDGSGKLKYFWSRSYFDYSLVSTVTSAERSPKQSEGKRDNSLLLAYCGVLVV